MPRPGPSVLLSWARRRLLLISLAGLMVAIFFAVITARMFVWPPTDEVGTVDAVVIFAGGRGERLQLAEKLMDQGVAPVLVIPNGLVPGWQQGSRACTEDRPYQVRCLWPDPDTTRGEARVIAALAEENSWETLLAVTSSYQLSRAGWLLSRCFEGEVLTTRAQPELGPLEWAERIGHEWLAWSRAATVERDC